MKVTMPPASGVCSVCGNSGEFINDTKSIRESYKCQHCGASTRYRHQAEMIVATYSKRGSNCFAHLAREPEFETLRIYEPGVIGPFRRYLSEHTNYQNSYYWPDVALGESRDGVLCQNLEQLALQSSSIDLMISSDILEHVRRPQRAFEESFRILKPGAFHIFTVPLVWPLAETSVARVDTTTDEDVHLLEPAYHSSPLDPDGSLVYTDFGLDLVAMLEQAGFRATLPRSVLYNLTVLAQKI